MEGKMEALDYLYQAAGRQNQNEVDNSNLFKEIGFDRGFPRLGWVKPPSWNMVELVLRRLDRYLENKDQFVFIGMGGSINGIKTLHALAPGAPVYCLDSLDPEAVRGTIGAISDKSRTLVIPITKSGTTTESQLLARTFQEFLGEGWQEQFLWLSDREAFEKLDALGWQECSRDTIQIDGHSDIGGRFTSPHTLIFILPLYLMLNRDLNRLKTVYTEYLSLVEQIDRDAQALARQYRECDSAFFFVPVRQKIKAEITTWITQLFQESLGSKKDGFYAKTIVGATEQEGFLPVDFDLSGQDDYVYLMGLMHYLHIFVASFAFYKNINFVNQPSVEKYKQTMKTLENAELIVPEKTDLEKLMNDIEGRLSPSMRFIEVLLYFHPSGELLRRLEEFLLERFPGKVSFIFLGSDWNHHSFQAAFKDIYSLYVILTKDYLKEVPGLSAETLENNITTMRRICQATYQTIEDKALYLSL